MLYALCENGQFLPEIKYAFEVLLGCGAAGFSFLTYEESRKVVFQDGDAVVSYGFRMRENSPRNLIHIYQGKLFGKEYLSSGSFPSSPLRFYRDLPVIYEGVGDKPDFVQISGVGDKFVIETNIDLLASSFFLLTRYEEVVSRERDRHGRFPASASLASREGFLRVPVVNQYIELLWSWIESFNLGIKRRNSWGNRSFGACVTYDVDLPRKFRKYNLRELAWLAIRDKDTTIGGLLERIWSRYVKDPHNMFPYIFKTHEKYGIPVTFYLKAGGVSEYDMPYRLDSSEIVNIFSRIKGRGEIGFHGSYDSYSDLTMLRAEKAKLEEHLESEAAGVRQHFLRWETPLTWRLQEQAGFKYDSTLMYADQGGFRAGICLPFKPFDVEKSATMDIWEIPPTLMDGNLFTYMKLTPEQGLQYAVGLIDEVKRVGGLFVLIWHNSSFDRESYRGWKRAYEGILRYLREVDAAFRTPREAFEHYALKK